MCSYEKVLPLSLAEAGPKGVDALNTAEYALLRPLVEPGKVVSTLTRWY